MNNLSCTWCVILLCVTSLHSIKATRQKTHETEQGVDSRKEQVCSSFPCVNGGTCVETGPNSYKCSCAPYYVGEKCLTEPLTNIALSTCATECEASSNLTADRSCYASISGASVLEEPSGWASNYERVGAWIKILFTDFFRIHNFALFDRIEHDISSSILTLETSDLKTTEVSLMCLGTNVIADKFWQQFDLIPTVSSYLSIEISDVCNPTSTEYVGFRGVMVYGNDVPLMNAASLALGAWCSSSSAYHAEDFGCHNAIDGVEAPGLGNEWASDGEGAGAWIYIDLNQTRTVMAVGFLQRCSQASQNNFLMLEFSDTSTQEIELECFSGVDPVDCEGQYWQQFDLDPYVVTSYVKVTITATCAVENNGFREIRVFSLREDGSY